MSKFYKEDIYHFKCIQKKREKLRRRRKRWKKHINRFSFPRNKYHPRRARKYSGKYNYRSEKKSTEIIKAPENFSLVNEPVAVLKFFDKVRMLLRNESEVILDFSDITNVTSDAIALLLAKITDPKFRNRKRIFGTKPKDEKLDEIFFESGFYKITNLDKRDPTQGLIHTKKNKKVDCRIAVEVRKLSSQKTFGFDRMLKPLYRTLIECMANTKKHARGPGLQDETWWLAVFHDSTTKITKFSFIDTGVGIFRSTKVKKYTKFALKFGLIGNQEILIRLLEGKIESSTGLPYRGKGLPKIYSDFNNKSLRRLYIVSNDVFANLEDGTFVDLKIPLNGTFLYWEIWPEIIT